MPFLLPICIVAFAFALLLTMSIRLLAPSLGLLDVPNERSSHTTPTPRGGGASFVLLVTAAAGFLGMRIPSWQFAMYAICAACVASVSYIDDLRSVSASIRFGVQTAAAIAFMSAASAMVFHDFVPGILLSAALVFWIVSLTNMFNFMDGIDG
ncbi:MAG: hypothetical protein ABI718_16995, partial [Acidobacteriota bacterium]